MGDDMMEVPEAVQTAYMHSTHSRDSHTSSRPRRDYPIYRVPSASDVGSIDTDIVPPSRIAKAPHRRPPIPDLRFEQSYLASISGAETWGKVAWITTRDQILLPLIQGTLWTLALSGLRYWNRGAHVGGRKVGTSIRQLWWRIQNKWQLSRSLS